MYHRFDSPVETELNLIGDKHLSSLPSSGVYFYDRNVMVDSPWAIPSGASIVIITSGNLTINKSINITPEAP